LEILEEKVSGYNSGDEHLGAREHILSTEEWKTRDEIFSKTLSEQGLIIKDMEEDGACLFRAISYQLYGDQEMHDIIRQQTMDYIYQNREYFAQFITEGEKNNFFESGFEK
jgi:OTU domain-containing protein 5